MISKVEIRTPASPKGFRLRFAETRRRDRSAIGFTLVELLVVISIISLLVAILVPAFSGARKAAANVRTGARVVTLADGCNAYHNTHDYYPGQMYSGELKGSGGSFTGSQWLARSLFTDPDASTTYPNSKYAPVKPSEDLIVPMQGIYHTISDTNTAEREVLPILYYPARLGVSGLAQYQMSDNSDYKNDGDDIEWESSEGSGTDQAAFENYIKDRRFLGNTSTTPYSPGAYLLIAAGRDRLYGTNDDIRYPSFENK